MNLVGMKRLSPFALALAVGPVLMAQSTTGSLAGTIKDAKGGALANVKIIITSPALFGARTVVTDDKGNWHAPLLPPGNYRVVAAKDGFIGGAAENIRVGLGSAARQDLILRSQAQVSATVEVVATSAEVDKSDTKAASNFSAETLNTLPTLDRSFTGAMDLAPGLVSGNDGTSSIRGGTTQSTLYRVNGTDVKDDYQGALTGTYAIEDNIEDVQVILSPLNARNGRSTGGSVNVVTKSGGNTFAGSIRAKLSRPSWEARTYSKDYDNPGATSDETQREYQVTLSGPIVIDRVWFSLGTILKPTQSYNYSIYPNYTTAANRSVTTGVAAIDAFTAPTGTASGLPSGYAFTKFDQGKPYTQKYDDKYYEGKITGAITTDHTLEISYSNSKVTLGPRNPFGDGGNSVSRLASLGSQTEEKSAYGFVYRGVLSASTFIEARWNKVDSRTVFPSGDPAYGTGELLLVYQGSASGAAGTRRGLSYPFGFGISPNPDRRNNRSGNFNLKKFIDANGTHELDLGIDYYEGVRGTSVQSGGRNLAFRAGGAYENNGSYLFPVVNWVGGSIFGQDATGLRGAAPTVQVYSGHDGTTRNETSSIYANDQWTINSHWNVMFGLRVDSMKVKDTDGKQILSASDFSPRFQARYDLKGDSKHLFTFTAARFNSDFTTAFTDAFVKKANSSYVSYGWSGNALNPTATTSAAQAAQSAAFVNYDALTNLANYQNVISFFDSSKNYVVDGSLKTPYMDELTFGYRRGYEDGSSVKLTFVHRQWKRDWAFAVDYDAESQVLIPPPAGSTLPAQYSQQTRIFNSNDLKRQYNGLEIEWVSKLSTIWTFGGNLSYSRLVGNNQGGDAAPGGQSFRDNTPSGYYTQHKILTQQGVSEDLYAPTGPLYQDQRLRGRAFLTAELPLGKGKISYSWLLRYDTGKEYSASNIAPLPETVPVIPNASPTGVPVAYTKYYGGRGQYSWNDQFLTDFKINFSVPLGVAKVSLIGDIQISNLFNQIEIIQLDSTIPTSSAGYSALYLDTTAFGQALKGQGSGLYYTTGRSATMSLGLRF